MNISDTGAHHALAALRFNLPEDLSVSSIRAAVADHVEALIDYLDSIAPDPDLEPDDDREPSLGWTGASHGQAVTIAALGERDLELDCDTDESDAGRDTVDDEPMLGWPEDHQGQGHRSGDTVMSLDGEWTASETHGRGFVRSGPDDHEDDDPAEEGHDDELPLGWSEEQSATGAYLTAANDAEPSMGWPEQVSQLVIAWSDFNGESEETALETHGAGFRPSGGDDVEDNHDAEACLDEDGEGEFRGGSLFGADEPETHAAPPLFPEPWSSNPTGAAYRRPDGAHPQSVVLQAEGDCMLPLLADGDRLCFEPVEPKVGEIGLFFIEGEKLPQIKFLAAAIPPAIFGESPVVVRFLNPPTVLAFARERLRGVWRFHSVITGGRLS